MGSIDEGYKAPVEFQVDSKEPLVDISLTDSTELWLIQWPINQPPDFDGQEVSLKLHHDGRLGSFESSSGKSYKLFSLAAQAPDATVFQSSLSDSKVVGKISRRVSLVHYPEPTDLEKKPISNHPSQMSKRSGTSSYVSHPMPTPTHSHKDRSPHSRSGMSHSIATSVGGRQKISLIETEVTSRSATKKRSGESTTSVNRSTRDSGAGRSDVTSLGSAENFHKRKSKKIIKDEQ